MITVLELRELLLEFITAVETHEWVMDSVKTSGDYKDGQWHNQNAFEIHQKLCDEIGSKIPFTDYMENPTLFGHRFRFDSDSDSGGIRTPIPKIIRTV